MINYKNHNIKFKKAGLIFLKHPKLRYKKNLNLHNSVQSVRCILQS